MNPTEQKIRESFNAYCKKNGINANGQFAVEDGMPLFTAGYLALLNELEPFGITFSKQGTRMTYRLPEGIEK